VSVLDKIIEESRRRETIAFPDLAKHIKVDRKIGEMTEYEKGLARILALHNIKVEGLEKIGANLFKIPVRGEVPDVGAGYGFTGGMARAILEKELGIVSSLEARDIDIVKIIDEELNEADKKVGLKFNEDDVRGGHDIEKLEADYFHSRDFTINEVLATRDAVYLTKDCLLDTARGVIRFTDYEISFTENEYNGVEEVIANDKLMAKAVRLSALYAFRGREAEIADKEVYQNVYINDFHLALHLDRALQASHEVAVRYIEELDRLNQLPEWAIGLEPEKIIEEILLNAKETNSFVFRSDRAAAILAEKEICDNFDKYQDLEFAS
jgi:hypothetical protein